MSDPNRKAEKAARLAAKQAAYEAETAGLVFHEWPKIARLNRDIAITEKIDGTNAAISIVEIMGPYAEEFHAPIVKIGDRAFRVYAQSRNRILTVDDDNFGFARWVKTHEAALAQHLGAGLHFGEWWGVGIGRGYDLSERRFSLFNVAKWGAGSEGLLAIQALRNQGIAIDTVPLLYEGPWTGFLGYKDGDTGEWLRMDEQQGWPETAGTENPRPRFAPNFIMEWLKRVGSQAAPGYARPEGICVFHKAAGIIFKATVENDEKHKFDKS